MTARAVFFSRRRGAYPGLSQPMLTGDGLLVRLHPIGTVSLDAWAALCKAARRYGNGIIEVTSRGSIQVRGLSAESAPLFADEIAALGIAAADGVPVISGVLGNLDPAEILDSNTMADEMRRALARGGLAARLPPKVSIIIDGGGSFGLHQLAADIRLRAEANESSAVFCVSVGGDEASAAYLGSVTALDGVASALRLLEVIASRGGGARARDINSAEGGAVFRSAIADLLIAHVDAPKTRQPGKIIATRRLRDGSFACGIGLPFGHGDALALERLANAASAAGARGLCVSPDRALFVVGLTQEARLAFTAAAEQLGFIVHDDDPRRHVIACAGAPTCAAGHIPARAMAPAITKNLAAYAADSFSVHISGCAKGCAHSGKATLTIVGVPFGCALIGNGTVRDAPFATAPIDDLPAAVVDHMREARHG